MKHYVVLNDWAFADERNVDVLGVVHSQNEAYEIVAENIPFEKRYAEMNDYDIIETDNESYFDAYKDGYFEQSHTLLYIKEIDS